MAPPNPRTRSTTLQSPVPGGLRLPSSTDRSVVSDLTTPSPTKDAAGLNGLIDNANDEDLSDDDFEHVTFYIKNNLEKYKYKNIVSIFSLDEVKNVRFTVDYKKDLEICRSYYQKYLKSINFKRSDIISALKRKN